MKSLMLNTTDIPTPPSFRMLIAQKPQENNEFHIPEILVHYMGILLLSMFFPIITITNAQSYEWVMAKGMGGTDEEVGFSVTLDASGNIYTVGRFSGTADFDPDGGFELTSSGFYDIFISKLDGSGNFVWAKSIGGSGLDYGNGIILDASGNIYISGHFQETVDFDPGSGVFNLTSAGGHDIFISKLDGSGNFIWAKSMGGTDSESGQAITIHASGNVYTTGVFFGTTDFDPGAGIFNLTSAGFADIFISKLDDSGNFIWAKTMGGTGWDLVYSIAIDASDNVHTIGWFEETVDFDPGAGTFDLSSAGERDIFISKLDGSGNFEWAISMGGTSLDSGESIALDETGNVYATGWFRNTVDFDPGAGTFNLTSAGYNDIFVSKVDASGNFVFALKAGETGDERGYSIALDAFGNSYLTGFFDSPSISFGSISLTNAGDLDICIAKVGIGSGNQLNVSTTSSTNVLCNGENTGSATASASDGSPPYTYNWSNGGSGSTINNLIAGTYIVTVTDNNSATATASVTITQPPLLVLSPPLITNVSCAGGNDGSIQASATGGVAPYLFNWSNGANGATISNLAEGSYTVTVTDDNDCTKEATYMVTQPEDIVISLLELNIETCEGEEDGSISIAVTGGVNPIFAEWSNGFIGLSIVDLAPDTYSVTVTDNNDCTETASYTINPGGTVNVTLLQIQDVSCNGGSNGAISVSASGGNPPYTYVWSNGMMGSFITGLTAGTYHVTVTDANGCAAFTNYTVNEPTALSIITTQTAQNLCFGDTIAILEASVSGGTPGYTALWSDGTMGLNNTNLAAGTYTVTVTDINACTSMESATITDPPQLIVSVSTTDETAVGANDGTATATAGGGTPSYSFIWSNGGTTTTISGLSPGIYTVTITDLNGCTSSASGQVNAFGCTLDIQLGQDVSICEGDTAIVTTLIAGGSGSVLYAWTDGSADDSLYVSSEGEYCVTVTDEAGCLDVECIIISEIIIPLLSCPVTNESVPGANDGAIQCDSIPGLTYLWSNGATTSSISGLSPGEYCVTATDVNGCTRSQCFNVQPANCQMSVASAQTNVSCHGDSTGSITLTVAGATEPVIYSWSNGGTTVSIHNLNAGSYSVTVSDAEGCVDNQSFLITEPLPINITVDSVAPVQDFDSGLIWITVSGGGPPYMYSWTDPEGGSFNSEDLNNLFVFGNYSVTVTDGSGCVTSLDSIFVDFDLAADLTSPFKALKVYPVPADNVLYIDTEIRIAEAILAGADGRLYKHLINPASNKIDVSDLGSGWYFLKVADGKGWYFARIVKVRVE